MPPKECLLVIGDVPPSAYGALQAASGYDAGGRPGGPAVERLVLRWQGWEAPEGEVLLEAYLREALPAIRAEHAAWAYEMGRLRVRGKELARWLAPDGGLSMWWCSLLYERHPKMTPGLYGVYKLRALERLLDAESCVALRVYGGDARLRDTLARLCRASHRRYAEGDEVADTPRDTRGLLHRLYAATPPLLRAMARLAHWWWTVRRRLPALSAGALPPTAGPSATIVTYFPNVDMEAAERGRFRSRYWEGLHDALNAAAQKAGGPFVRWLFIRFPSPQLSLPQCIALRDRFRAARKDGASFHYLEECLRPRDLLAACWHYARLALAGRRLEAAVRPAFHFAGSQLDFWEMLGPYWVESFRGWRCLERCLQYRAFQRYAALAGPQRWTLFPLENCPWERMCCAATHAAGNGPVFGAQHSSIRPTDFRYFDDPRAFAGECAAFQPDALRGNGQSAVAQWRAAGVPAQRLGEVEALRYLYLAPPAGAPVPIPAGAPVPRRLLVVTSFFADETEAHLRLLARALGAGLLDGWELRLKPHPYLPVEARLRALAGGLASRVQLVDGPIAGQLTPGVTVWASNSTTVALEAAVRGLPVLVMRPADDMDLCPLQDVPGLLRTGSLEDVSRALAAPVPLELPPDYLCLDRGLPRWLALLGLNAGA